MSAELNANWERRLQGEVKAACPRGIDCRLVRVSLAALVMPDDSAEVDSIVNWACSEDCGINEDTMRSAAQKVGQEMVDEGAIENFSF